jgi:hypothetical protein
VVNTVGDTERYLGSPAWVKTWKINRWVTGRTAVGHDDVANDIMSRQRTCILVLGCRYERGRGSELRHLRTTLWPLAAG